MTENLKKLHVLLHTSLKIVFAVIKMAEKYKSCCVVVAKLTILNFYIPESRCWIYTVQDSDVPSSAVSSASTMGCSRGFAR